MSDSSNNVFRRVGLVMAASVLGTLPFAMGAETSVRRPPNILYVFSDMQRATSMGCYGDPNVHTPSLDTFARQGARFDAAMSNTPVCCPHRASLMTGLYGHHHGVVSNLVKFTRKARGLAELFHDAGYVTGYAGKWHIPGGYGSERTAPLGFPRFEGRESRQEEKSADDHYVRTTVRDEDGKALEKKVYKPTLVADQAIRFIEEKSKGKAPWLFVVSWLPPHTPYAAPPEFRKHYQGKLQLPPNVRDDASVEYARMCLPDYYGMVESLDVEFQRILNALDRAGVAEDTIVCYSSDHGDMLGSQGCRAKRWPYEESSRVPFLIRYPRAIPTGRVIVDPFSTVDVYPTLAGLAGLKTPEGIDGLDYSPFLTGQTDKPPRDYVFLQMLYGYVPWPGWRALRTREYTYARKVDGPWLLYHTAQDPYQLKNLVVNPEFKPLVEEMDKRLTAIMKETGDSWQLKATNGDIAMWSPGSRKLNRQNLGMREPGGQGEPTNEKSADASKKRKNRRR